MARERVQKLLAAAGLGSRRSCEQLVSSGRVTVNGQVIQLGARADPDADRVAVDGVAVDLSHDAVTYALNKPSGIVTSASDPAGRPVVVDLVPEQPRVFPIGRLDIATEGLLLLTNDGDLAQVVTHPRHGVEKTYVVEVPGALGPRELGRLRRGVELDDGPTAPARIGKVSRSSDGTLFEITIHEGRNRQVRRMVEEVGSRVRRLVRIRVGSVRLGRLAPGQWRPLAASEVHELRRLASGGGPP